MKQRLAGERHRLATAAAGLRPGPPRAAVERGRTSLADIDRRGARALRQLLADLAGRLEAQARLLDSYGYQQVLERGFVLARDDAGRPVTSAAQATPGKGLALRFADGERHATVDRAPRRRKPGAPEAQRRLI